MRNQPLHLTAVYELDEEACMRAWRIWLAYLREWKAKQQAKQAQTVESLGNTQVA